MKVGYYGYDATFRNLFPLIIKEAEETRGHEKGVWLPPQAQGIARERMLEFVDCDILLLGLSSFQTQEELAITDACRRAVIIADVPGSELRPKAREWVREQAALPRENRKLCGLIIALETDREKAITFGYPSEDIHYLGPPPHWGASYRQMMDADVDRLRQNLLKRRGNGEPEPLAGDEVLVYVPGTKMPLVVNAMLRCAIDAGRAMFGEHLVLGFSSHPGEKAEKPEEEEMFRQAFAERRSLFEGLFMADVSHLTNPQRYAVADLCIISGGPTESIAAAYAHKTHIAYYRDEAVIAALAETGVEGGKWFVPELGAALLITTPEDDPVERLHFLRSREGQEKIRENQKRHFPLPRTWDTAPAIVDLLERVAGE